MVKASCGHKINSFNKEYIVSLPSINIDFNLDALVNSISYVVLCKKCYKKYKKLNMILDEEKQKQWLANKIKFKYIW